VFNPRIKLRHLVTFLEVARLRSVVKAAVNLGVTQPAVSKTIQELETTLEVPLFDRSRRSLVLTSFGEVFLRHAGASVTALRQGIDSLDRARNSDAVAIRIGALPTASARILPRAMARFTAEGFRMKPRVVTGPNGFLLSQLRLGDLDLVIGRMADPEAMTGFAFEHLYSEKIVLVVRPGHPLLDEAPIDFARIELFQVLMPPHGSVIRPTVDRFLVSHGIGPFADEIETVSDSFGGSYVRSSDAIWIISEGVVAEDIADRRLVRLPIDTSDTLGPVGLTTRADTPHTVAMDLFMHSVREVVQRDVSR
jgi:LysR family pca operon transcriptional activator